MDLLSLNALSLLLVKRYLVSPLWTVLSPPLMLINMCRAELFPPLISLFEDPVDRIISLLGIV